jgi:hypothetical protein
MKTGNKFAEASQASPAPAHPAHDDIGFVLTGKQTLKLFILLAFFFGALLYFGYKDWRHQQRMQEDFEEHLRRVTTPAAPLQTQHAGVIRGQREGGLC